MVTISVELDDELCSKARAILESQGFTLEDVLRIFLEYIGDPKNEKEAIKMIRRWIDEEIAEHEQIPKI